MMLTHLDLFSGIGGFALAAQAAGFTTIGFCEKEPYAQKVLIKNFDCVMADTVPAGEWRQSREEKAPIHADIFALDGKLYAGVSLITGGFPCQPFSHAGKRRGKEDDRHLWPEMFRVIDEARPALVLGENVPGIINLELDNCISDLESIGYTVWPLVIPACAVDARHRRDRVWILCADTRYNNRTKQERQHERAKVGNGSGELGLESGQDVAHSKHGRLPIRWRTKVAFGENGKSSECARQWIARTSNPRWQDEAEWFAQSGMGRVADGIPHRVDRLKGLGNAIVPKVAEIILCMMREQLLIP